MREIFKVAARAIAARGFRVRGTSAERQHGSTLQRIYLQADRHNQDDFGMFFVNVALTFDELCALDAEKCVPGVLHWSFRLERLVPGIPSSWELRHSTDRAALAARLGAALHTPLALLESVLSPEEAIRSLPEMEGFELVLRARLKYVSGDFGGAVADLVALKKMFPDRVDVRSIALRENMPKLDLRDV